MRLDKRDLWIVFLLLTLVIIFFSQVLFTHFTYVYRDFYRQIYPSRYFVWQCVKEGYFPLWNPYLYGGHPFFGSLQHSLLNLFSFFIYLFPFDIGIKLFIVWHFVLSGVFMYLLMREFGVSKASCLIAGLAYTFNAYMLSIDTFSHLTASCWTPLIFLLFNRAISSSVGKLKYTILTAISLSLQFVGEELTILYATLLALSLFAIAKIISFKGEKRKIVFIVFPSIGLISIGLVLIQLIPFIEVLTTSYRRASIGYQDATYWSLYPLELFTLILPVKILEVMNFLNLDLTFPTGLFKGIYFGIVPFFLILVSLCEKRRRNLFWFAIFLGSIILALGDYTPFYKFLYNYFPTISMHRYPVKFFCLSIFSGSILVGFGFDYLMRTIMGKRIKAVIPIFVSNLFLIVILLIWSHNIESEKYFMIYQDFFTVTTILSLFNLLVILTRIFRVKLSVFITGSILIIIFDLFYFGLDLNLLIEQKFYHYQPPIIRILKKDPDYFRFMIEPKTVEEFSCPSLRIRQQNRIKMVEIYQQALIPNLGLIHRIHEIDGYGFLYLEDYRKFKERLISGKFDNAHRLLNLSNVKYIISMFEIPPEAGLKLLYKGKKYGWESRLYKNPTYLPRAFFVPNAKVVKNREEILNILTSEEFDPKKEVILEEKVKIHKEWTGKGEAKVKIIDYKPNRVTISTWCDNNGFLFLSDTYYPGWKAYIDGKPTKIYRANFLFRAIILPKGTHKVEFNYFPLSFKLGLIGSLFTVIILIGIGIFWYVRRKYVVR